MTKSQDLIEAANRAYASGSLDQAQRLARQVLEREPDSVNGLLISGIVCIQRNEPGSAIGFLERLVQLDTGSFEGPFWLSMAFRKAKRFTEAQSAAQVAVSKSPRNEHALNQLGICHLDLEEWEAALGCFHSACGLAPRNGTLFENFGRALQGLGRNKEAVVAYRQALSLGPVRPALIYRLGDAHLNDDEFEAAANCARSILQMEPNSVQGTILMASALIGGDDVARGAEYAKRGIELSPGNAMPVAYYGRALQSLGRIEEADEQFRRSIELEPRQGFAYHSLVHNHKVKEEERPLVAQMEELLKDRRLPMREIIQLEYALGKALEDLGDYEQAMLHFDQANRIDHELKIAIAPFRPEQLEETAQFLIRTFTPSFFDSYRSVGKSSEVPIFVVGMMRSGTTLAEQILSSHWQIGGVGEQMFWPQQVGSGQKVFNTLTPKGLNPKRLSALADEYLKLLATLSPGNERVVDKMNTNYLLLGLLHLVFPNARVVHMKRHPVDTCLSIWATPVAHSIDLCASKENIIFAYEKYLEIMAHWRLVIPADRLLEVQYEELVADREAVTRRMIDFCGLDWDEACLSPESNQRSVKTPSVWQVRQPVYKTSVARWRKFEPWLGPFEQLFAHCEAPT